MKLLYTDNGAKCRLVAILLLLLTGGPLLAQEKIVLKGTVRDATTNEPLVGVSILTGTPPKAVGITNANGAFSVLVAPDAQMIFRYMGFADYRFKVKDKREVVIRLTVTENKLTEAIVVGYQKKTRELGTGSAAIVGGLSR